MVEGELTNGLLKGYGRKLNSKGECKVGFWDILPCGGGDEISVPNGKWSWYTKDGKQKVPEDYYIGKKDPKQPSQIMIRQITLKDASKKSGKITAPAYSNYKENVNLALAYSV